MSAGYPWPLRPKLKRSVFPATQEAGHVTDTKDKDYNVIWFTEQCLSNVLRLETYVDDADRGGDSDLADFFRRAQETSRKGASPTHFFRIPRRKTENWGWPLCLDRKYCAERARWQKGNARSLRLAVRKTERADQEMVRALSHPIRVEILETLRGRVASPSELSREIDESLGVIAYHANTLVRCGCLELLATKPSGGNVEHFFGITPRSFVGHQEWRQVPAPVRAGMTGAAATSFLDAAARALAAGTIDGREDTTLSWAPLTVDEKGWREITLIMDRASDLVVEAHARSARRLTGGSPDGIAVIVGLAAFEAARRRARDERNPPG
jgi:DNA-binding transcriptional ArsR family regulator